MSDLFEEDDAVEDIESVDDFDEPGLDENGSEVSAGDLDARRRLENMLEEKRLRDELDDFLDF